MLRQDLLSRERPSVGAEATQEPGSGPDRMGAVQMAPDHHRLTGTGDPPGLFGDLQGIVGGRLGDLEGLRAVDEVILPGTSEVRREIGNQT